MKELSKKTFELANELVGKMVADKNAEIGVITSIDAYVELFKALDIKVSIDFNGNIRNVALFKAVESKAITFLDEDVSLVEIVNSVREDENQVIVEEENAEKLREETYKKIREEKDLKAKEEKEFEKKNKMIEKYHSLSKLYLPVDKETMMSLGWLAKHTTSISAQVPKFVSGWFASNFPGVKYTVVDTDKKTSGGFPMKYSSSFSISLDSEKAPTAYLLDRIKNKKINDTDLVYMIIRSYGFNFGDEQDVESIRREIPSKYSEDFEIGYNK